MWTLMAMIMDGWPTNAGGPPLMLEYGDIILDTPPARVGMKLTPDLDDNFGLPGTDVDYQMSIKNKGIAGTDTFELGFTSAPLARA